MRNLKIHPNYELIPEYDQLTRKSCFMKSFNGPNEQPQGFNSWNNE